MTTHDFQCEQCGEVREFHTPTIAVLPPDELECACGGKATKLWGPAQFICRGDPDDVGLENLMVDTGGMTTARAAAGGVTKAQAKRKERKYQEFIDHRRRVFREEDQVGGKMTHQVPAELYHAKIRQTGDPHYWSDPNNLNRHKSCKVS